MSYSYWKRRGMVKILAPIFRVSGSVFWKKIKRCYPEVTPSRPSAWLEMRPLSFGCIIESNCGRLDEVWNFANLFWRLSGKISSGKISSKLAWTKTDCCAVQRSCQLDALLMREMETGKHLSKTLMAHWTQSKCVSIKPKRTPMMSDAGALVGNFAFQVRSHLFFTRMPRALGVPKTLPCLLCFFSGMGVSFFMPKTHTTQVTQPHLILGQRYLSSSPSLGLL